VGFGKGGTGGGGMIAVGVQISNIVLVSDGDSEDACSDISKRMNLVALPRPGDSFSVSGGKYDNLATVVEQIEFREDYPFGDGSVGVFIFLESTDFTYWRLQTAVEQGWLLDSLFFTWDKLFKKT
jgi:hypothetical protein